MAPTFDNLLDVLNSKAPPPVTNFVSYVGSLDMLQIQSLSKTLRTSSFAGGLRLKSGCRLTSH